MLLKILHLEDTPQDAELIRELLIDAEFDLSIDRVATEKDFVSLLRNRTYDLILADFKLPGFDGFVALQRAIEICPEVPFICVSGTIGEEAAVELIRQGAVDYVIKDRLKKLPSAIIRALDSARDKAALRQAEHNLRQSEERFRAITSSTPDHIFIQDSNLRYQFVVNPQLGLTEAEIIGKTDRDFLGKEEAETLAAIKRKVLDTGEPSYVEVPLKNVKGEPEYFSGSYIPKRDSAGKIDGLIGYFRNINDHTLAEQKILKLNRTYAVLSNINQLIVRQRDKQKLLNEACDIAVEYGKFRMCWIGLADDTTGLIIPVAKAGVSNGYLDELHITLSDDPEGMGSTGTALCEKRHDVCNDIEHDERMLPWKKKAPALGFRSSAAFPLCLSSKCIGAIHFYSNEVNFFDEEEITLLDELAKDISFALESMNQEEQRVLTENLLHENERRLSTLMGNLPGIAYRCANDKNWTMTYLSKGCFELTGYTPDEFVNNSVIAFNDIIQKEFKETLFDKWQDVLSRKEIFQSEYKITTKDGKEKWVWEKGCGIYSDTDHVIALEGFITDITERKQMEEQIKQSLKEKEILLRELYHRTKNNMQVICSLLRLQARKLEDKKIKDIFKEIETRIYSMALVHQKLIGSKDLSYIDAKEYFDSLIIHLKQSYFDSSKTISFQTEMENISILMDTAIPLGLVFNELISNIIKHAFTDNANGQIKVHLYRGQKKQIILEVSDNGIGFPKGFDIQKDVNTGLETVLNLVRKQLDGKIDFNSQNGLHCKIVLKDELYEPRV